jgi:predicted metal-dependent phosphoesterase TrpH
MTTWRYPGARWLKLDVHTHTPHSTDTYWATTTGGTFSPTEWLLSFMRAKVDCVAVTDHNGGAWIDDLKASYDEMRSQAVEGFRELTLFPGVEISVQGGFHLLALFDPSKGTSDIARVLGRLATTASSAKRTTSRRRPPWRSSTLSSRWTAW